MGAVTALLNADESLADEDAFALWEMHMNAAGCSPRTIRERRILMRSFGRFIEKPITTATRMDLIRFLGQPQTSPKTKQNYRSALHTFFSLLQDEGMRADNPSTRLPRNKVPRSEANPFSTEQVQLLLDSGIYGKTRMMVLLAAYQGFRAVEISAVAGRNIDWDLRRILTVDGKGGVEVWRPLHPAIWEHAQTMPREGFWFPSDKDHPGEHILPSSVSNVLSKALARAGITGHRPHQLRAWHATELVESGADMLTVQHSMRHASPSTLRHYLRPSMGNIEHAIARLPELRMPTTSNRLASARA